jgi:glycosidase
MFEKLSDRLRGIMKRPVIYQLVIRYFGNTNRTNRCAGTIEENGCGKFDDINDKAIQSLADLGVTHVWLTGVLRQATLTDYSACDPQLSADVPDIVKGRAGSFYAVRDYVDVSPDYISNPQNLETPQKRMSEFRTLVDRLHAHGLKVLIDFVPNHVSRAYRSHMPDCNFGSRDDRTKSFDRDNSFYYYPGQRLVLAADPVWIRRLQGVKWLGTYPDEDCSAPDRILKLTGNLNLENGEDPARPSSARWYESIKLNYGMDLVGRTGNYYDPAPRTWKIADRIIQFWQDQGVDGFRCDMAHFVPDEFWRYLIEQARARGDVYFIAEAYERQQELVNAGFDAVYHFQAYNALLAVYAGAGLERYDAVLSDIGKDRLHLLNYIENHDEARIPTIVGNSGLKSGFGSVRANYQLAPLQLLSYPGPVMLFNGQEIGQTADQSNAGFASASDGRTTFFDYWCMPEFADWVNGHAYDGGCLTPDQTRLRKYYRDLLELCQDSAVRAPNYWGLRSYNPDSMLFSFARYQYKGERLILVAANFRYKASETANVRLPLNLTAEIGWRSDDVLSVFLLLDHDGSPAGGRRRLGQISRTALEESGVLLTIPEQDCWVLEIA